MIIWDIYTDNRSMVTGAAVSELSVAQSDELHAAAVPLSNVSSD